MTVLLKGKLYPFSSFYIKAGEGGTPTTSVVEYYTEGTIPFIPDFDNDSPSRACVMREDINQWPDSLLLGCCV